MPDQKYTGASCWSECFGTANNGRCRTVREKVVADFRRAVAHLKREPSVVALLADALGWRISPILFDLFDDPENYAISEAIRDLELMKEAYERACLRRETRLLDSTCITVHTRTDPYSVLCGLLGPCISDPDDVKVILDAHDLAQTVRPLTFFSGDRGHIILNRDAILENTAIDAIRSLGGV